MQRRTNCALACSGSMPFFLHSRYTFERWRPNAGAASRTEMQPCASRRMIDRRKLGGTTDLDMATGWREWSRQAPHSAPQQAVGSAPKKNPPEIFFGRRARGMVEINFSDPFYPPHLVRRLRQKTGQPVRPRCGLRPAIDCLDGRGYRARSIDRNHERCSLNSSSPPAGQQETPQAPNPTGAYIRRRSPQVRFRGGDNGGDAISPSLIMQ